MAEEWGWGIAWVTAPVGTTATILGSSHANAGSAGGTGATSAAWSGAWGGWVGGAGMKNGVGAAAAVWRKRSGAAASAAAQGDGGGIGKGGVITDSYYKLEVGSDGDDGDDSGSTVSLVASLMVVMPRLATGAGLLSSPSAGVGGALMDAQVLGAMGLAYTTTSAATTVAATNGNGITGFTAYQSVRGGGQVSSSSSANAEFQMDIQALRGDWRVVYAGCVSE